MAKAMTGTFTITTSAAITALGYTTTAIPIGSLIDVGDAQALEIESVDYVYQNYNATAADQDYEPLHVSGPFSAYAAFGAQLMDRNNQEWLAASDNNLISSSAAWILGGTGQQGVGSDFFPDDFQKNAGRFVVNDELYLVTCVPSGAFVANQQLICTVRIRAKVVKLSTRDWMAISLETVQNE